MTPVAVFLFVIGLVVVLGCLAVGVLKGRYVLAGASVVAFVLVSLLLVGGGDGPGDWSALQIALAVLVWGLPVACLLASPTEGSNWTRRGLTNAQVRQVARGFAFTGMPLTLTIAYLAYGNIYAALIMGVFTAVCLRTFLLPELQSVSTYQAGPSEEGA